MFTALRARKRRLEVRIDSLRNWDAGYMLPPAERAKHRFLARLARERNNRVFIESGTFLGNTTMYMSAYCELVLTVELDRALYEQAQQRFADVTAITVFHGDATEKIPELVRLARHPPLVWLDGHYSGGITAHGVLAEPAVTILRSLDAVEAGTTIVVDDLRLFGDPGHPSLCELVEAATAISPNVKTGPDSLVIRA